MANVQAVRLGVRAGGWWLCRPLSAGLAEVGVPDRRSSVWNSSPRLCALRRLKRNDHSSKYACRCSWLTEPCRVPPIQRFTRLKLEDRGRGDLAERIAPYRAGYTPSQRREIERRLVGGELLGVAATSALDCCAASEVSEWRGECCWLNANALGGERMVVTLVTLAAEIGIDR